MYVNKESVKEKGLHKIKLDAIDIIYIFRKIHVNASLWQKSARFI